MSVKNQRRRVQISFAGSLRRTKQAPRDEVNVNNIIRRHTRAGTLGRLLDRGPLQYGDVSGVKSYQDALHVVMQAQEAFAELPANLRQKFQNDPAVFVEFCSNKANKAEMRSLGLLRQEEEEEKTVPVKPATKSSDKKKPPVPKEPEVEEGPTS